jgi:hypothetical protein
MKTYVASIGEKAVMAFRAEDDDQARAIIEDRDGSMQSVGLAIWERHLIRAIFSAHVDLLQARIVELTGFTRKSPDSPPKMDTIGAPDVG